MADDENDRPLTERQSQVLALHREGKNPTEIGAELGVTSQGIHGHLRRLAKRGLITLEGRRPAAGANAEPNGTVRAEDALAAIRRTAQEQADRLNARLLAIDEEVGILNDEREQVKATLVEVNKVLA